ncbi:aldo/keto reductase [Oceaniglobus trochenteri]|uniref:aldo/keto reductase n=1 Tax=Oceaniglobus trochenteri TaxID=2763260 RepID=UPI001CFF8558|nr:aldo/keto reductase [Oceaniglobus trochenteri]
MTVANLTLNDGARIPQVGFGVWQLPDARAPEVIGHALNSGYRHIDTAHAYNNEEGVGIAVRESGLPRDDIFVTSKLWNMFHGRDATMKAFDGTMQRLGLETLDMYLIHWPVPMEDKYVESWKAMIELRDAGRIKSIGVSNFNQDHLQRLIDETGVVPVVNQIELHPRFQQRAARDYHEKMGIRIESWSPLGQGNIIDDPVLKSIAAKHGKGVGQVILRWHVEQGLVVIPRSKTPKHIDENLQVFDFALDAGDMEQIAGMDRADGRIGPVPTELGVVNLPPKE